MRCSFLLACSFVVPVLGTVLFSSAPVGVPTAEAVFSFGPDEISASGHFRRGFQRFKEDMAPSVARLFARDCGLPQEIANPLPFEREEETKAGGRVRMYVVDDGEIMVQASDSTGDWSGAIFDVHLRGRKGQISASRRYFLKCLSGFYDGGNCAHARGEAIDVAELFAYQILKSFGFMQVDFLTHGAYPGGVIIAVRNIVPEGSAGFPLDGVSDLIQSNAQSRWSQVSTLDELERLKDLFSIRKLADVAALLHCLNLRARNSHDILQIVSKKGLSELQKMEEQYSKLTKEFNALSEKDDLRELGILQQKMNDLEEKMVSCTYQNSTFRIVDFSAGDGKREEVVNGYSLDALLGKGYDDVLKDSRVIQQLASPSFWEGSWWDWLLSCPSLGQQAKDACLQVLKEAGITNEALVRLSEKLRLAAEGCCFRAQIIKERTKAATVEGKKTYLKRNIGCATNPILPMVPSYLLDPEGRGDDAGW